MYSIPSSTPSTPHNAEISRRVSAAMADLARVPRNGRNDFAKYNYATADDVFDAVRPVLARHNLEVRMTEAESEVITYGEGKEQKRAIRLKYEIGFAGTQPETRTMFVMLRDAQSLQAAATYTLKYWLRTKLLLSTGETDDEMIQVQAGGSESSAPARAPANKSGKNAPALYEAPEWVVEKNLKIKLASKRYNDSGDWSSDWRWKSDKALFTLVAGKIQSDPKGLEIFKVNEAMLKKELPVPGFNRLKELVSATQRHQKSD